MLIPIGTNRTRRRSAVVTYSLIAVCVVVHLAVMTLGRQGWQIHQDLAVWRVDFRWWELFSSAFLHGGLLHLAFNMIVLAALGPNVEDKLGHAGFALLYAAGAAASAGSHIAFSTNPAVGASGAIAAVTGAYLVLFPATRIICFAFWITVFGRIAVPAWWFIGLNIAIDLLAGGFGGSTGIAHAAHLGGYGFGIVSMMVLLRVHTLSREPGDLFTILRQKKRRADIQAAVRDQQERVRKQMERGRSGGVSPEVQRMADGKTEVARLIRRDEFDQAASAYERFVEDHDPSNPAACLPPELQLRLAEHLLGADRTHAAAAAFRSFIAAHPSHPQAGTSELMLGLLLARRLGRAGEAKPFVERAVEHLSGDERHLARQLLDEIRDQQTPTRSPTE